MSKSYTQLYFHIVYAVKYRMRLLPRTKIDDLFRLTAGTAKRQEQRVIAFNAEPDHVHYLLGMNAKVALSDVLRSVKSYSSKIINEEQWTAGRFSWQGGFGAFSVSYRELESVKRYIQNQERHHRKVTYQEEVLSLLDEYGVSYNQREVFNGTFIQG